jgi:hypothetical protein
MPAQAAITLTVTKATPEIQWQGPSPIAFGTALGEDQLNASASIPGKFEYSPAAGEKLEPGVHTLSVAFTPTDTFNYTPAEASVPVEIYETAPTTITWFNPSTIAYGIPLSEVELNATASAAGTLDYAPGAGDVLAPGTHRLTVTFTPSDPRKDSAAVTSVEIVVEPLPDIEDLLAAASQSPAAHSGAAAGRSSAHAGRNTGSSGSPTAAKVQRETRTYKGAVYEKGDDGQWHLQQK